MPHRWFETFLVVALLAGMVTAVAHAAEARRHRAPVGNIEARTFAQWERVGPIARPTDGRPLDALWDRAEGLQFLRKSNPSSASFHEAPSPTGGRLSLPVVAADLVAEARRYLGSSNFTRFAGPWCKAGLNIWLRRTGHYADRSLRAIDALRDGPRLPGPAIGAIAVMTHHVAIVTGVAQGGVWTISANHNHRVGEGFYPRRRIIAFIQPSRGQNGKL